MARIDKLDELEGIVMEWVPVVVIVVFLTGLGIVAGYAIKHAKKS